MPFPAVEGSMNSTPPPKGIERELRLLAHGGRWHIVQVNRRQSLAEHQYFVALYAWRMIQDLDLCRHMMDLDMAAVFREALIHDLPEAISGDIPSPVHKVVKANPGWKGWLTNATRRFFPWYDEEASPAVRYVVGLADLLEACLYLAEESTMGNTYVRSHLDYLVARIKAATSEPPPPGAFLSSDPLNIEVRVAIAAWISASLARSTQPAQVLRNPSADDIATLYTGGFKVVAPAGDTRSLKAETGGESWTGEPPPPDVRASSVRVTPVRVTKFRPVR